MIRILAVDDDHIVLTLIEKVLEKEGYLIDTFEDGARALKEMERHSYHIILSDLMMPGMDGEDLFGKAKSIQPDIPFVFLTSNSDPETAVRIMKLGADDYIQKPFKGDVLLQAIFRVISEKKEESFIRKTLEDKRLEELDREGIFSWKKLYGGKDTEQANRLMEVLSRNMEQGGGFLWLDMLKEELNREDEEFDDLIIQRSVLAQAVESAEYMRKIINDLAFISRFQQMTFPVEKVSLKELQELISGYYSSELIPLAAAHSRKISLNFPAQDENFQLEIHRENLFKSLKELMCNALKYSPEDSKIFLMLALREKKGKKILEISFWNSPKETLTRNEKGEAIFGIPYELSESVFELFYTFESFPVHIAEEEWSQGSGLYIVRKMVEKMKGCIDGGNIIMHRAGQAIPYVKVTISLVMEKG